jgi:Cyclin, N-terminal domain
VRESLVSLIVEVHQKLCLGPETLYLTVSIFDRFLSQETVTRVEAKLVAMCAMHIASKYEEVYTPQACTAHLFFIDFFFTSVSFLWFGYLQMLITVSMVIYCQKKRKMGTLNDLTFLPYWAHLIGLNCFVPAYIYTEHRLGH